MEVYITIALSAISTVIVILIALFAAVRWLDGRITREADRLDNRIDNQTERMDKQMEEIRREIVSIRSKVDRIEGYLYYERLRDEEETPETEDVPAD